MLESLNQTNIGRLNLPEPVLPKDGPFDPALELSNKDWNNFQSVVHFLTSGFKPLSVPEYIGFMADLKVLDPERYFKLEEGKYVQMPETVHNYIQRIINLEPDNPSSKQQNWSVLIRVVGNLRIYDPLEFEQHKFNLSAEEISSPDSILSVGKFLDQDIRSYLRDLLQLGIAFPGHKFIHGNTGNADWMQMSEEVLGLVNEARYSLPVVFTDLASQVKILFPSKYEELGVGSTDWKRLKEVLKEYRETNKSPLGTASLAFNLKIMAAESALITDQGLEVIMPDPRPQTELNLPTPAIPETRKF